MSGWGRRGVVGLLIGLILVSGAFADTQTINTLPGSGSDFLSDLQAFLGDEPAQRDEYRGISTSYLRSGGIGSTDASLTHTISSSVAFIDGYYVSQASVSHTYTASKDTYVFLREDDERTVTISGTITYDGNLVFVETSNSSARPQTPSGCLSLFKAVTNATAITSITDYRRIVVLIDVAEADQGATASGSGLTLYDVAQDATSSSYVFVKVNGDILFDTSLDFSYPNFYIDIAPGSQLARTTGDEVLTVYSPENLIIGKRQVVTLVDMIDFSRGGEWGPDHYLRNAPGTTDMTNPILYSINALPTAYGSTIKFFGESYLISDDIEVTHSFLTFKGETRDKSLIVAANSASSIGTGVFKLTTGISGVKFEDLSINGNSDNNTSGTYGGIVGTHVSSIVVENCRISSTPKDGILFYSTNTANSAITIKNNILQNIGWAGIIIYYPDYGTKVFGNTVVSTGSTGIAYEPGGSGAASYYPRNASIVDNYINKAAPPTTIYNGNSETGVLIQAGQGGRHIIVDSNTCIDNRNSGFDGIGAGQAGSFPSQHVVISNNIVMYTGLFGIDVTNGNIITGNLIYNPAAHGVAIVADNGGDIIDVIVSNNIIVDVDESDTGNIYGIAAHSLVSGATFSDIQISDNIIKDSRGVPRMQYGIKLDSANATITDVSIYDNQISGYVTGAFVDTGGDSSNIRIQRNTGYITENSGTSGAIATGATIAHGLSDTPTVVNLSSTDAGVTAIYWSADATNITVNYAGGGTHAFHWEAKVR